MEPKMALPQTWKGCDHQERVERTVLRYRRWEQRQWSKGSAMGTNRRIQPTMVPWTLWQRTVQIQICSRAFPVPGHQEAERRWWRTPRGFFWREPHHVLAYWRCPAMIIIIKSIINIILSSLSNAVLTNKKAYLISASKFFSWIILSPSSKYWC